MSSQSQLPVHPPPPILPVHPFQIWKTMTIFNQSVSSKHRLEPESKKRNVNDVLDWLSIYSTTHNTFVLKCFLQFAYSNLDGSQKVGGNFLNLLQEGGYPERGGGSNPGGNYVSYFRPVNIAKSLKEQLFYRTPPEAVACKCCSKYVFLKKFCNLHR